MHRKVRFNQFLGLTNAQWMEKLAPFCAFFNEVLDPKTDNILDQTIFEIQWDKTRN